MFGHIYQFLFGSVTAIETKDIENLNMVATFFLYILRKKTYFCRDRFIIKGSYIGYMFRLIDESSSGLFSWLSHKVLCTYWDPSVFTSIKYMKLDQLPKEVWCTYCVTMWLNLFLNFNHIVTQYVHHTSLGNWFDFMYFVDINTLGSQYVHSTLWQPAE